MQVPIQGLVSTIVPVYNRPRLLVEAVDSVLAQSYRPIEILIVDDGSTDETGEVADRLARQHPQVLAVHQTNGGPGRARETGRLRARGEFVQYLDSDDLLLSGKLEAQVAGLRGSPHCGVSYGWTRFRYADGSVAQGAWKGSGAARETMFPSFLRERWWDTPNPLYRASVCSAAGPWSDLRLEEDWEYDCRVAALGTRLHHVPKFVVEVRQVAGQRLSGQPHDSERLARRARAHELILGHARRAGVLPGTPEMQHFARELFLLARQCGAVGLSDQSRRLLSLARQASGNPRTVRGLRVYRLAAALLGWRLAGALACWGDRFRSSR
jgi:hypothetical protein